MRDPAQPRPGFPFRASSGGGGAGSAETSSKSPLGSPLSACREVFKAKHRKTGQKVALKKVLMENEKEGVSMGWGGQVSQLLWA